MSNVRWVTHLPHAKALIKTLILCEVTKTKRFNAAHACCGVLAQGKLMGQDSKSEGEAYLMNPVIADKIHSKISGLVNQPLSVTDTEGAVLATDDPQMDEQANIASTPWSIEIIHAGSPAGYIILSQQMVNHEEVAPLVRSISELIMHQSLLIEQLPQQEERLDKFVYDLVSDSQEDSMIAAEAKLFDIDLEKPRIAMMLYIDDPVLTGEMRASGDRDMRITRYKFGINRGLNSYYTTTRNNIISYLGNNTFCVLKDLDAGDGHLADSLDRFKKSINTIYGILRSELKQPTTVGIGNYHPGIDGLRKSYNEAVSAIDLGSQNWDKNRVYHIDDFGVVAPLLSGVDEANIYFSRELLEKLGENDNVIQTLESFFANNMGLTQTADELNIHRNTLVYRLDRIAETLSLDPRKFEDAVQIKLAILFTRFVEQ